MGAKGEEIQVKEYIESSDTRVVVYRNNETGEWLWAVAVYDEETMITNSYWLNAFRTKREAMQFVKDNKLKLYSKSA